MNYQSNKLITNIIGILLTIISFFCIKIVNTQQDIQGQLQLTREGHIADVKDLRGTTDSLQMSHVDVEHRLDRIQTGILVIQEDIKELIKRK